MREGWEHLGEVEDRHKRGLERRFRTALKRLDDRLGVERDANQRHKQELIARIEAPGDRPGSGASHRRDQASSVPMAHHRRRSPAGRKPPLAAIPRRL
jgi:hypothetical protein